MTELYVDADACPVREEIYRVAERLGLVVHLVSNGSRPFRPPGLPNVHMVTVAEGTDAADDWIAERIQPDDVCVTNDIPLAARCLARRARALAPKGHVWTTDNIGNAIAGREASPCAKICASATVRRCGPPTPLPRSAAGRCATPTGDEWSPWA
jgi:uncharacterized protein YaiI (UPF0178 family)